MIILDLEWNSGLYDSVQLDEILQIGAVKVAGQGSPIVDTFNCFIRPQVHPRYSPAAAQLPDLALAEHSELDFPAAMAAFWSWCGGDTAFASWGGNDLTALARNVKYWKLQYPLPPTYIDLQRAFSRCVGAANSPSLERALEYCQAPDIFDPHNALYDAVYTWTVCQRLPAQALADAMCPTFRAPKPAPLPRRQNPWRGPYQNTDAALNSGAVRRVPCPKCGAVCRVNKWHPASAAMYYGPFTCSCGGRYYQRLEVRRRKDGVWGNTVVFKAAGRQKEFFDTLAGQPPISCKPLRRHRRGRGKGMGKAGHTEPIHREQKRGI